MKWLGLWLAWDLGYRRSFCQNLPHRMLFCLAGIVSVCLSVCLSSLCIACCALLGKVKSAVPLQSVYAGCSSPFQGHWARRWIDHWVCDAWPVRRQTYGYLPSCRASPPFGRYQIILLGDRGTWVWTTCPELLLGSGLAGIRTRDLSSRANALHTEPPSHPLCIIACTLLLPLLFYCYYCVQSLSPFVVCCLVADNDYCFGDAGSDMELVTS